MAGSGLIFDDQGNIWPAETHDLRRALSSDLAPSDLAEFVVRNMGFVAVEALRGDIRLRLRPDILSGVAFQTLMHWLARHSFRRAILTPVPETGCDELIGSPQALRRRLFACVQQSRRRTGKQFHRSPLALAALSPDSPIRVFRSLWDQGLGPDAAKLAALCNRLFKGRFAVSEVTPSNELIIREHGRGYATYSETYLSRCIGQRIEDDPDMEYGRWAAEAHRQALMQREPLIEDVDVAICGAGQPGSRVSYQRIIAPLAGPNGRQLLLSASVLKSVQPFELAQ